MIAPPLFLKEEKCYLTLRPRHRFVRNQLRYIILRKTVFPGHPIKDRDFNCQRRLIYLIFCNSANNVIEYQPCQSRASAGRQEIVG